jgi:hypothetical protein
MKPIPRSAVLLSTVVLVCASAASLATLMWRGSFPHPPPASTGNSVLAEARGWSAATLLVAIPMSCISLWAACRGSLRGRLVWLGAFAYFVYTYLEFAVSPPFTALYLVYVTAFACAIPALVIGATSVDGSARQRSAVADGSRGRLGHGVMQARHPRGIRRRVEALAQEPGARSRRTTTQSANPQGGA